MIYNFASEQVPALSQVGGKAKALIEMTKAGFRVPEGFVLSADFFKEWIQDIKKTEHWNQFLDSPTKKNCDKLKKEAMGLPFTQDQNKVLYKKLDLLSSKDLFAVRSSSPEEDLKDTSFAGQYETILGVKRDKIQEAIHRAFASMLDFRVVEYKKLNNVSFENPRIAVIIQRQIDSRVSGVAFSLNPQNNAYDEAVINASFGLGETIVSGQVTPDTYIVDKIKGQIQEKKIMEKSVDLWLQEDGGIREKVTKTPKKQALKDEEIIQVAKLTEDCEAYYKRPIDIEWAVDHKGLYLLQARPITTYFPLYEEMMTPPGEPKNLYLDLILLTQGFSDSFSVLGLEIWSQMLTVAKKGFMSIGPDGAIYNVNGKQYMNISNMAKGFGPRIMKKMMGSYEAPLKKIFDEINFKKGFMPRKKPAKVKGVFWAMTKTGVTSLGPILKAGKDPKAAGEAYQLKSDEAFEYYKGELMNGESFSQMVHGGIMLFGDLADSLMSIGAAQLSFMKIKKMFKGHDMDNEILTLAMDLPTNPTSQMGYLMLKLASYDEFQQTISSEEFVNSVRKEKYSREFLMDLNHYMERYGSRCFKEIDIASLRTSENMEKFYDQLKHLNIDHNNMTSVKARKEESYEKLCKLAKKLGKEKKFKKHSEIYTSLWGYREDPKYLYVVLIGELRKEALAIGKEMVTQGRMDAINHIFDLTIEQVSQARTDKKMDLRALRIENIGPRKHNKKVKEWPKVVDSRGKIYRNIRESEEGDLIGDPIAPGRVQGRAKVLSEPYEKPIKEGEILVTRATEPSWTPIFVNAAGVVLEIGGPLQHGAIIAREYGIPCVSGVIQATSVIKDGDLLEVDGSSGIVKILSGGDNTQS